MKSEIRNPKSETNPNFEIRREFRKGRATLHSWRFRVSGFGFLSDFGFRISGFRVLLAAFAVALAFSAAAARGAEVLLFSFFRDNGQDGLFLAWSADGLTWSELKPSGKSFLQPVVGGKLMRDPCLALGPDGEFRMVWTTGWGKPPAIGYAHSRDLLNWSEQKAVPVMSHEPEARNAWAPELFYDECYIYFDHYAKPQYYGATKSRDLQHWQDISDRVHFPRGARHGTVLKIPETIVRRLQTSARTP